MGRWKDEEVTKSGIEKLNLPQTMATSIRERRNFQFVHVQYKKKKKMRKKNE